MERELIITGFFLFGLIIGSFLNVVTYRLHTNRSLGGRSHCMSCGHALSWYELVPLFSYLVQWGRCRACHSRITPRYAFVEGLTGVLFAVTAATYAHPALLLINCAVMAVLVLIVAYDMLHTIIPDECVLALSGLALCAAFFSTQDTSLVPSFSTFIGTIPHALLGAVIASGFFAGLWIVSKGRWIGLGDAKLAIPLGFMVGWPAAVSLIVLAFWIGAVVSLAILFGKRIHGLPLLRGKLGLGIGGSPLTMKSEVPFAPFLVASFVLVALLGANVFVLTAAMIPVF